MSELPCWLRRRKWRRRRSRRRSRSKIKAEKPEQDDLTIRVRELETKLQEGEAKLEKFEAQWKAVGHMFGH
jgi:hypothetical protein